MSQRVTAVSSHRRFVLTSVVTALREVFDSGYNRDHQLVDLKVTTQYPLEAVEYPCIVVSYNNQTVKNAGVGHEEWFPDKNGIQHKWHHSRFEGTFDFEILGLTPLDRDILADALTEVVRFGRLDAALLPFFTTLYGDPSAPVGLIFNQIMFNADEITSSGNSASLAVWSPEDLMQYSTTLSSEVHGGYYNVNPSDVVGYITRVVTFPYLHGDQTVILDLEANWSNPFRYTDISTAKASGLPGTLSETRVPRFIDSHRIAGAGIPSGTDTYVPAQSFSGVAQPDFFDHFDFAGDPNTLVFTSLNSEANTNPGPLAPGDALFMFVVTASADTFPAPPWGLTESGWTLDHTHQIHDTNLGSYFDINLWHYIWQISDDASTYQAIFDMYPDSVGGSSTVLVYSCNGANGDVSFQGATYTGSYNNSGSPGLGVSIPMGEGSTMDYIETLGVDNTGYHADAFGAYYNIAGGGVQVFAGCIFGLHLFTGMAVTPRNGQIVDPYGGLDPASSNSGPDPLVDYTMQMWDYIVAP